MSFPWLVSLPTEQLVGSSQLPGTVEVPEKSVEQVRAHEADTSCGRSMLSYLKTLGSVSTQKVDRVCRAESWGRRVDVLYGTVRVGCLEREIDSDLGLLVRFLWGHQSDQGNLSHPVFRKSLNLLCSVSLASEEIRVPRTIVAL